MCFTGAGNVAKPPVPFGCPNVVAIGLTSLFPMIASSQLPTAVILFAGPNWIPAVQLMPDPARIGGSSPRRARVNPVRIRRVGPDRLFETGPTDSANDGMAESRYGRGRRRGGRKFR